VLLFRVDSPFVVEWRAPAWRCRDRRQPDSLARNERDYVGQAL